MIGWELKVTMVFIILKSQHFDPFLHVKQTLYPVLTDVPTSQGGESPGICGFSDHLASFHWHGRKLDDWLQHTETYFSGIQILDVGGFWGLLSNLAAASCFLVLRSGCGQVLESLGQQVCVSRRRQREGQSVSLSLRLENRLQNSLPDSSLPVLG